MDNRQRKVNILSPFCMEHEGGHYAEGAGAPPCGSARKCEPVCGPSEPLNAEAGSHLQGTNLALVAAFLATPCPVMGWTTPSSKVLIIRVFFQALQPSYKIFTQQSARCFSKLNAFAFVQTSL